MSLTLQRYYTNNTTCPEIGSQSATLSITGGDIKIWKNSTKSEGEETARTFRVGDLPLWRYVEVRSTINSPRLIEIELSYEGYSDKVKATGVWATKTGFKNELTDSLWDDAQDPLRETFDTTYGGKFGIQFEDYPVNVQYAMGIEFTVSPNGIGSDADIVFDVTRQIEYKDWIINDSTVDERTPWKTFPSCDESNDESPDNSDNDNTPENNHVYSIDGPGESNDGENDQVISRNNFYEFVRVRFDRESLGGNNSNGSRCSSKIPWHAFYWIEGNGTVYQQKAGKTNEVDEGHLTIGEPPTP